MNCDCLSATRVWRPDVIFVGAGINSLAAAYLLGKAG